MTDERIDLNQFEAITKGKWEVIKLPGGGIDIGVRTMHGGHMPIVTFTQSMGEHVSKIERDVADMNAIAAVPRLIAELERLRWKHMQVLKQRKDLRDERLRLAEKLETYLARHDELVRKIKNFVNDTSE
jgi:hypothetical protein